MKEKLGFGRKNMRKGKRLLGLLLGQELGLLLGLSLTSSPQPGGMN